MATKTDAAPAPAEPAPYMTFQEVADALRIARPTIYDKVAAGQLTRVNVGTKGTRWRITRASFDAYRARIESAARVA